MQILRLVVAEAKVERKDRMAKVRRDKRRILKILDPRLRASSINKKEVADWDLDVLSNTQSCRSKRSEVLFVLDHVIVNLHRIGRQQEIDDPRSKGQEESNTVGLFSALESARMGQIVSFPI